MDIVFYCSSLSAITIPDTVTSIGGSCFDRCSPLKEILFKGDAITSCSDLYVPTIDIKYIFEKQIPDAVANAISVTDENCYYRVKCN